MAIKEYKFLTPGMRDHFLKYGWVRIEGGVSPENLKRFSHDVWVRIGYDPNDKSTWEKEKVRVQPSADCDSGFNIRVRFTCLDIAKYQQKNTCPKCTGP